MTPKDALGKREGAKDAASRVRRSAQSTLPN
jgi:hypothetical protein